MPVDRQHDTRAEVLRGTLEMLVLKLLSVEPMHGWGLSLRLREISRDVFDVNQGSIYPALQATPAGRRAGRGDAVPPRDGGTAQHGRGHVGARGAATRAARIRRHRAA